jgi:hypothetical protein
VIVIARSLWFSLRRRSNTRKINGKEALFFEIASALTEPRKDTVVSEIASALTEPRKDNVVFDL